MNNALKTFLLGLSIPLLIFAAVAVAQTQKSIVLPTGTSSQRWVIYQHPEFRADQYLLDTQTGKVWQGVVDKDGTKLWQEMEKTFNP